MKAESSQIPQKLDARLKFAYCLQRKSVFVRPLPNADFLAVTGL